MFSHRRQPGRSLAETDTCLQTECRPALEGAAVLIARDDIERRLALLPTAAAVYAPRDGQWVAHNGRWLAPDGPHALVDGLEAQLSQWHDRPLTRPATHPLPDPPAPWRVVLLPFGESVDHGPLIACLACPSSLLPPEHSGPIQLVDTFGSYHVGSFALDRTGQLQRWNTHLPHILGWAEADLRSANAYAQHDNHHLLRTLCEAWRGQAVSYRGPAPLASDRGQEVDITLSPLAWRDGEVVQLIAVIHDETYRTHADTDLRLAAVAFNTVEGLVVTDHRERIVRVNDALCTLTGYSAEELVGQTPRLFASGVHGPAFYQAMWTDLLATGRWQGEVTNRHRDGHLVHIRQTITAVRGGSGEISHFVSLLTDVTSQKQARDQLDRLTFEDALTGLANRSALDHLLPELLSEPHEGAAALVFIDLDDFKLVNDTRGHAAGDELIVALAQRLRGALRNGDIACRFGGDEFVLWLPLPGRTDAVELATAITRRLLDELAQPVLLGGGMVRITACAGVALVHGGPTAPVTAPELIMQADTALFAAKRKGHSQLALFQQPMGQAVHDRARVQAELEAALSAHGFMLYEQVQTDAAGALQGVECLIRWQHPERGLLAPAQFIPAAEASSIIVSIGRWVIHTAIDRWVELDAAGVSLEAIGVNISAREFRTAGFTAFVLDALRAAPKPVPLLIEVTESLLLDDLDLAAREMHALAKAGVRISLDDFGTGYSSLRYLQQIPLHQLKIDRSFVAGIGQDHSSEVIVSAIAAMAVQLDLEVVAEGIETPEQFAFLSALGCQRFQGYLLGRPAAPAKGQAPQVAWQPPALMSQDTLTA